MPISNQKLIVYEAATDWTHNNNVENKEQVFSCEYITEIK